jgi:DNA-binding NarL/FixJ family response regulator
MEDMPDIVLVDVNLEGGDEGIEVARWLREVCDVNIIFVTGHSDNNTIERIHEVIPSAPVLPKLNYHDRSPTLWQDCVNRQKAMRLQR